MARSGVLQAQPGGLDVRAGRQPLGQVVARRLIRACLANSRNSGISLTLIRIRSVPRAMWSAQIDQICAPPVNRNAYTPD